MGFNSVFKGLITVIILGYIYIYTHTHTHTHHCATARIGPGPPHYRRFTFTWLNTPQFVRLLWTSDQPEAETST